MNPQDLPKGAGSGETNGNGKPINAPGVYLHEASGNSVTIMPDAKSTAQQDAAVRAGFVYQGPPPSAVELQKIQLAQAAKTIAEEKDNPASSAALSTGAIADTPTFSTTSTRSIDPSDLDAANARAAAAEAELAELKGVQTPDKEAEPEEAAAAEAEESDASANAEPDVSADSENTNDNTEGNK